MNKRFIVVLIIAISTALGCSSKLDPDQKNAAINAARQWLLMVDAKAYEESWQASAEFLKTSVPKDQWVEVMEKVRTPMGNLVSREVTKAEYRTMLPKALKGHYVIIKFDTSFSGKASVGESVTQMLEDDGSWRVGGYQLK
jgi:hypothetical protein